MKTKHMIIAAACMACSSAAFSQTTTTIVNGRGGATVVKGGVKLCPIDDTRVCGTVVILDETPGSANSGGTPVIVRDNDGKSIQGVLIGPMPEDGVQGRELIIRGGKEM